MPRHRAGAGGAVRRRAHNAPVAQPARTWHRRRRRAGRRVRTAGRPPAQAPAQTPPPPHAARAGAQTRRRRNPPRYTRTSGQPRFPGRRPARGAAHVRGNQRPEHRHRSDDPGHGRRGAARRAVGSGARHHPAREQARLRRGRHDRAHRAADGAGRRRNAAAQADGRAGARRRAAGADARRSATRSAEDCGRCSRRRCCRSADRSRPTRGPTRSSSTTWPTGSQRAPRPASTTLDRAAAAGRDRSAHRPDDARVRAQPRRAVGRRRPREQRARQHDGRCVPEPGQHHRPHGRRAGRRRRRRLDAAATASTWASPARRSAIGLALGSINGALNLDVALSALEKQGQGRMLSTPRVSTQNNIEAEITQGVQIPIQTVANNTVTVTFKDAALTLKVTPQITAANTVIMRIAVENASPDFSRAINGHPADRHAARDDAGAGQRRRDDGHRRHLRQPASRPSRTARRGCTACRCSAGCSSATRSTMRAASC